MSLSRRIVFLLLCACLCASGSSFAFVSSMPAGVHAAMQSDCGQMHDDPSMPDHATTTNHPRSACCNGVACCCFGAHGVASSALPMAMLLLALTTTAAPRPACASYASPSLARLVRPPIS